MKLTAERGWSYYDVARETGMSPSTLYKYYHACIMPGVDTLAALADVFDMTMDELIGRSVNKESES
jgi:transcriptional regulator with XRE-family HTH domain